MRTRGRIIWVIFLFLVTFQGSSTAFGSFIFYVQQNPQSVLISGSGTLNISALTFNHSGVTPGAGVEPYYGILDVGPYSEIPPIPYSEYTGIAGPAQFGSAGIFDATRGTGDSVGLGYGSYLTVPLGYVSGAILTDSSTYDFYTFAQLGLTPGVYVYTWGSGPTFDSLTINIGVVPEPASVAVIGVPAAIALLRRRRGRLV